MRSLVFDRITFNYSQSYMHYTIWKENSASSCLHEASTAEFGENADLLKKAQQGNRVKSMELTLDGETLEKTRLSIIKKLHNSMRIYQEIIYAFE
jgi:hypothetical protein